MTGAPRHPGAPYFEAVADRLGTAYLRYAFTRGTDQEVAFLLDVIGRRPGARLLDVGCGPGRHAVPLAEAGLAVVGIDVSRRFLDIAAGRAREAGVSAAFFRVDAREMPFDDEFDAVISICQGAFALMGDDDGLVLRRIAEAARPGGIAIVTAPNAYFAVTQHVEAELDADRGLVHERTTFRDEEGRDRETELWTGIYTPRELRLLALGVGLMPEHVWSVAPGDFARRPPSPATEELMLVARKPA